LLIGDDAPNLLAAFVLFFEACRPRAVRTIRREYLNAVFFGNSVDPTRTLGIGLVLLGTSRSARLTNPSQQLTLD
jgi:hypothetical protein